MDIDGYRDKERRLDVMMLDVGEQHGTHAQKDTRADKAGKQRHMSRPSSATTW